MQSQGMLVRSADFLFRDAGGRDGWHAAVSCDAANSTAKTEGAKLHG